MTSSSRDGFLTSDAVGIIAGQGDRIDKLERFRTDPGEAGLVANYYPLTTIPGDNVPVRVGSLTLPRGYSRLTVACFFAGGGSVSSVGITFPAGWEDEHVLIGGFTDTGGLGSSSFRATGVGLMRSSSRKTSPFYARASIAGAGSVVTSGVIFVEPVGSVSLL